MYTGGVFRLGMSLNAQAGIVARNGTSGEAGEAHGACLRWYSTTKRKREEGGV